MGEDSVNVTLIYLNNDKVVSRGVGYILQSIKDAGHAVHDFFDTAWDNEKDIIQWIRIGRCDVVLMSSTSLYFQCAMELAKVIKSFSSVPILLGGIHATIMQGELLRQCPELDYICIGEGEDFIVEFLSKMESGEDLTLIKNLGYRTPEGEIIVNPPRHCTDIHSLGLFKPDWFNRQSVINDGPFFPGFCYVFATRGCPYRCSYCSNSTILDLYGKEFLRKQKIGTVIEELLYHKQHYGAQFFYFGDEMILFDEKYITELFNRVHDEVKIPYGCMCRVERITPAIVDLLCKTDCRYVSMGIECGDENFRRRFLNRRMTNQQIIDAFDRLHTIPGIILTSFNMQGFPVSYDHQLTNATHELNKKAKADYIQMTWFYPLPGTRLYDYCIERDLIDCKKVESRNSYFNESVIKFPISPSMDAGTLYPI